MRCTKCEDGRMVAGKETRHSGGVVVFGSCLRIIGVLAVFAACLAIIFDFRSFVKPELLTGYPPKDDLVRDWITIVILLGAGIMLFGGHLCGKRRILTCSNCEQVVSGGSETPFLLRMVPVLLCLGFLGFGGYHLARVVWHLDLPRFEEQTSAVWNERLAAEYEAWLASRPEEAPEPMNWPAAARGPTARKLATGGPAARAVLVHIRDHGGTPAAASLLSK